MSKVTYHEFRPGHWVKLVDGKIVGRATAEEVATWKKEKAEQAAIWQDVVQRAVPTGPKPDAPETPLSEPKGVSTEPLTIWQDILSQVSRTTPQAEHMTRKIGVPEKAEHALRSGAVETAKTVPPQPATESKPRDVAKAVPAKRAVKVTSAPDAQAASTTEGVATESATKAKPEGTLASKAAQKPLTPSAKRKQKVTARALSATKAVHEQISSQPLSKAKPACTGKAAAPKEAANRTVNGVIPKETILSEAAPIEVEAGSQPTPKTVTRQAKPLSAGSHERPSQSYLWIMAGISDDLVATVRNGLARYQERFHQPAEVVLCHMDDMAILEKANLPVDVRQGKGVPPRNFWIGQK